MNIGFINTIVLKYKDEFLIKCSKINYQETFIISKISSPRRRCSKVFS